MKTTLETSEDETTLETSEGHFWCFSSASVPTFFQPGHILFSSNIPNSIIIQSLPHRVETLNRRSGVSEKTKNFFKLKTTLETSEDKNYTRNEWR